MIGRFVLLSRRLILLFQVQKLFEKALSSNSALDYSAYRSSVHPSLLRFTKPFIVFTHAMILPEPVKDAFKDPLARNNTEAWARNIHHPTTMITLSQLW